MNCNAPISGGMGQTTYEGTGRIDHSGQQLLCIERHTAEQMLRGPHFDLKEDAGKQTTRHADHAET